MESSEHARGILCIYKYYSGLIGIIPACAGHIPDINTLLLNKNAVGISAGHDGSLYYYSKPNKKITKKDLAVAEMHFLEYNYLIRQEMALNLLAERFEFVLRKL